jgi:hypothetical protein
MVLDSEPPVAYENGPEIELTTTVEDDVSSASHIDPLSSIRTR